MHVQYKKNQYICLCLLIHTSAFCAIFPTHFKYMTRDVELHVPLSPWKIGFLIRGKCLFSLNIVITFFPPSHKAHLGKFYLNVFVCPN